MIGKTLISKGAAVTWIAAAILVIGIVGIIFLSRSSSTISPDQAKILEVKQSDQSTGPANAPVTIIEYSDFQCPACATYSPVLNQLVKDFPTSLRLVYRHFPLPKHQNSVLAARAAEAAGIQGKFWDMHDVLFENQTEWENDSDPRARFGVYATDLSLDVEKFVTDMISSEIEQKVSDNLAEATMLNLPGTPSFFINGEKLENPKSYEAFRDLIASRSSTTPAIATTTPEAVIEVSTTTATDTAPAVPQQ